MTLKEKYILAHLTPVEFELRRDAYLCGININNKDRFMYSITETVKKWVEKNGGKFTILSEKVINHKLGKKGFIVQITFPSKQGEMKNIMSTLFNKGVKDIYVLQGMPTVPKGVRGEKGTPDPRGAADSK